LALFNAKISTSIQKRHSYTGNVNSETPGDNKKRVSTLWRCFRSSRPFTVLFCRLPTKLKPSIWCIPMTGMASPLLTGIALGKSKRHSMTTEQHVTLHVRLCEASSGYWLKPCRLTPLPYPVQCHTNLSRS